MNMIKLYAFIYIKVNDKKNFPKYANKSATRWIGTMKRIKQKKRQTTSITSNLWHWARLYNSKLMGQIWKEKSNKSNKLRHNLLWHVSFFSVTIEWKNLEICSKRIFKSNQNFSNICLRSIKTNLHRKIHRIERRLRRNIGLNIDGLFSFLL